MKSLNKNFCAIPVPLLWKSLFVFIPLLTLIFVAICIFAIAEIYKNKKAKRKILSDGIKKKCVYLLVIFLSLLTYGIVGLNFDYYLLVFFFICLWILVGFFVGEHLKVFKIKVETWFMVTAAAVLFALLFGICYVGSIREKVESKKGKQTSSCLSRNIF